MKRFIAMAAALFFSAGISVFASGTNEEKPPGKRINYQLAFSTIELSDDIDLVLQESTNKVIDISGSEVDIETVDWKIKNGILYISSKKGSLKDKVKVTVSVNQLKRLDVYGKSVVNSLGELGSKSLMVTIDGDSYVSLKNTGNIYVTNSLNTELDVQRLVGEVVVRM